MSLFIALWVFVTLILPIILRKRGSKEGQLIATTLGILGTFVGIAYSLFNFDTSNISDAVPGMLEGLKLAFITSIAGMVWSLIIGIFPKQLGFETGVDNGGQTKTESELLAEILVGIQNLNSNIAGDDDTTLITQVQKMRISINDKQDVLKQSFDEFAKQMAENNTKALIEAVSRVMEDFNAKINDQLGENFKHLSVAVENLVIWQKQHKDQITTSTEMLNSLEVSIKTSVHAIAELVQSAQNFERISSELKESLEVMGGSMTGFKNLANTLEKSGEEIRNEMSELTKRNIMELGENLKGISEKLVEDYSYIQRMMQAVISKEDKNSYEGRE